MADANQSSVKVFPAGAVIMQESPVAPKSMVIVLQGNIGVFRNYGMNTQKQIKVLTQGNVHGELCLFLGQEQRDTLIALTSSTALIVDRRNINDFFVKQPALAVTVVEGLCRKMGDPDYLKEDAPSDDAQHQSSLFPESHGGYALPMDNDNELLFPTKTTCPICGHTFDTLTIFTSRLRRETTDPDQRIRYKGIEPLYYEIITCPNCLLSVDSEKFESVHRSAANAIMQKVGPYKLEMYIHTGKDRDTFTVFAGYYLALLSAPHIYDAYQMVTATLWLKISRLYQDVDDPTLFLYATKKALDDYLYSYQYLNANEKQSQQLCYMIGEMYFRLGEYEKSRQYLFMAKTNKQGTPLMQRQADLRIDDVRDAMQAKKEEADAQNLL